jgi:hypothetical protein
MSLVINVDSNFTINAALTGFLLADFCVSRKLMRRCCNAEGQIARINEPHGISQAWALSW